MPHYDYEVLCKDIRPDGASDFAVTVPDMPDARTARQFVERRIAARMMRAGTLRGHLVTYSAKRIRSSER